MSNLNIYLMVLLCGEGQSPIVVEILDIFKEQALSNIRGAIL